VTDEGLTQLGWFIGFVFGDLFLSHDDDLIAL
jgi:hypothetical protein